MVTANSQQLISGFRNRASPNVKDGFHLFTLTRTRLWVCERKRKSSLLMRGPGVKFLLMKMKCDAVSWGQIDSFHLIFTKVFDAVVWNYTELFAAAELSLMFFARVNDMPFCRNFWVKRM